MLTERVEKGLIQSIVITRSHIVSGQRATRSLWLKVSPRNPLVKLVLAAPLKIVIFIRRGAPRRMSDSYDSGNVSLDSGDADIHLGG